MKTNFLKYLKKHNIIINNEDKEYNFEYLFKRRKQVLEIIHFQKITDLSIINNILEQDKKFNKVSSKEKYINLYGIEEGTRRYKCKAPQGVSLEIMKHRYGIEEGTKKFDEYRKKQAYTNSKEYKQMTDAEFADYNKSRAVTLNNMIYRYGIEEGTKKFDEYRKKQAYTNSKEYLKERYETVNKSKAHTLKNYLIKYKDDTLAKTKLEEYYSKVTPKRNYSRNSQVFLWNIYSLLDQEEKLKTYFAELNKEYCLIANDKVYLYDFVCSKLNLCIEYHGDHYHGNPRFYKPDDYLKGRGMSKTTAKEKWLLDDKKKCAIETLRQYRYIFLWEYDIVNKRENVLEKIKELINEQRSRNI